MAEGQGSAATGTAGGARHDDYAKIETALQQTPRGRWFLEEYARRNRNADTALVLAAIERLEGVVKGEAKPRTSSTAGLPHVALPFARLKQDAETAAHDVADMEQATKDATADILLAAEAIQDFTWEMRDKGIDRATCETIERHTADIYAACSYQDVVYQRKENAIHLLRLIAEAMEAAIDAPQAARADHTDRSAAEPAAAVPAAAPAENHDLGFDGLLHPAPSEAEAAESDGDVLAGWDDELGAAAALPPAADDHDLAVERWESELGSRSSSTAPATQETAAHEHRREDDLQAVDGASSRLDAARLAVLFG